MGDDGVVLTDREREALAGLAEKIGDPWLARQLAGQDVPPPEQPRRAPESMLHKVTAASASGWLGVALLLVGAALVVTTFASSSVLGFLGLVVMGAGLWRLVVDKGDVIVRRFEKRIPAPAPPPPRTPPAAS